MPWLIAICFLLGYEAMAIAMGWTTLSRMAVNATEAFPYLQFLSGFFTGGLSVHFWWHWDPKKGVRNHF